MARFSVSVPDQLAIQITKTCDPPMAASSSPSSRRHTAWRIPLIALACLWFAPFASAQRMASTYANLQAFVDSCPQNDPYMAIIRRDFLILKSQVPVGDIACTEPYSQMPPTEVTDELTVLQALRFMYYMDMGRSGYLPWTQLRLYDWIKSRVSGINIVPNAIGGDCCLVLNGLTYIEVGGIEGSAAWAKTTYAYQAAYHQTPGGLAANVAFYAHEARHTEGNGYPHVTGCPDFPSGTLGCDETYDPTNLSAYAIQYYLGSLWASGAINLGYSCDLGTQLEFGYGFTGYANSYIGRFVTNPPPEISPPADAGGPCIPASSFALNSVPSQLSGTGTTLMLGVTASNEQAGWTSDSPDSWISVTSGANSTGNGQAVLIVNPTGGSAQSGTVVAAGQVVSLECGSSCTLSPLNTITFDPLPEVSMGIPSFTIAATASSGLPVEFSSSTNSVCTVSGATLTVTATGTCSITATQPGNAVYGAASPVTQSFTVTGQTPQAITFVAPASVSSGSSPFTIAATASSGLAVAFASPPTSTCTVSGSTVTIVSLGACSITATQAGNSTYSAAPSVTQTFPVLSSSQIRWSVNAAFGDGGSASGYFVLDTSNTTIPDWDVVATRIGNVTVFPPLDIPLFDFNSETSNANSGSASAELIFQSYAFFSCNNANGDESIAFEAALASVPTGAGGTITIQPGSVESILCDEQREITSGLITTLPLTNPPTFSPAPGAYTSNQTVTITDSTPKSTIYYTTDGSVPTSSSSVYSGPISVGTTGTIQSIATAAGYSASSVATANYTINIPPNFTIGANPGSLTVASGSQGAITLTITPQNGFSSAVTFSCAGLPAGATCAFNPSSVTPSGNSITTQLTIATGASASNAYPSGNPFLSDTIFVVASCLLLLKKRRLVVWSAILLSVCLFALSACGGGGSSDSTNPPPPTTATVTVTATSGSLLQTAKIALTITH
jgi:hypothetical protein